MTSFFILFTEKIFCFSDIYIAIADKFVYNHNAKRGFLWLYN